MNNSQVTGEPENPSDSNGDYSSDLEKNDFLHYIGLELERSNRLNEAKLDSDLRDSFQRRGLRILIVLLGIVVLISMGGLLAFVVKSIFAGYSTSLEPPIQLVAFVAPITSITVITITMLVGSSRVSKDNVKDNYSDGIFHLFRNLKLLSGND